MCTIFVQYLLKYISIQNRTLWGRLLNSIINNLFFFSVASKHRHLFSYIYSKVLQNSFIFILFFLFLKEISHCITFLQTALTHLWSCSVFSAVFSQHKFTAMISEEVSTIWHTLITFPENQILFLLALMFSQTNCWFLIAMHSENIAVWYCMILLFISLDERLWTVWRLKLRFHFYNMFLICQSWSGRMKDDRDLINRQKISGLNTSKVFCLIVL